MGLPIDPAKLGRVFESWRLEPYHYSWVVGVPDLMAHLGLTLTDVRLVAPERYEFDDYRPAEWALSDKGRQVLGSLTMRRQGFEGLPDGRVMTIADASGQVIAHADPYSYTPARDMLEAALGGLVFVAAAWAIGSALGLEAGATAAAAETTTAAAGAAAETTAAAGAAAETTAAAGAAGELSALDLAALDLATAAPIVPAEVVGIQAAAAAELSGLDLAALDLATAAPIVPAAAGQAGALAGVVQAVTTKAGAIASSVLTGKLTQELAAALGVGKSSPSSSSSYAPIDTGPPQGLKLAALAALAVAAAVALS